MTEPGLLVVVPTRDRAELAVNAIKSVLAEGLSGVRILVSDNSLDEEEAARLADFCSSCQPHLVRYVRPPTPMPMAPHWEWVLEEALSYEDTSHITYLTDRMVFKKGDLGRLYDISTSVPGAVITYTQDRVIDYERPVKLEMVSWSGKLLQVQSRHLLYLSSRGVFHSCLPRMLNSIVPRGVFEVLRGQNRRVFASIAPDFFFAYRCLDLVDSVLYYDKACLLHYALARSNGASQARGLPSRDSIDFERHVGGSGLKAAPLPMLKTCENVMFHEFCTVGGSSTTGNFPELDIDSYFAVNLRAVDRLEDPKMAEDMRAMLHEARSGTPRGRAASFKPLGQAIADVVWRLQIGVKHPVAFSNLLMSRTSRRVGAVCRSGRDRRSLLRPYALEGFDSPEDAISHANDSPREPSGLMFSVLPLLHPRGFVREVPMPSGNAVRQSGPH